MSQIARLLAQMCPDGVPYRPIGDIGELVRGNGMPKSDFVENGVGCIHYGQIYTYYGTWATSTLSFISKEKAVKLAKVDPGDVVITNTSENIEDVCKAVAWLGHDQIVTGGHATVLKHKEDPKYIAYYLQTPHFFAEKKRYTQGTKVMDVSANNLARIRIPIPPVTIQREIVKVLDTFSELEAELEARRRQYKYYRDALLSFAEQSETRGGGGVYWVALGEAAVFRRGTAITEKSVSHGAIPVVANGPVPTYFHGESNRTGETIVVARSGAYAGLASFWNQPIFLTDAFSVHPDTRLLRPRFVFHFLRRQQDVIHAMKKGSGVPHVRVKDMELFKTPVPTLEEQDRIVSILDQFDGLVNDLSFGLPAELKARRQQYEYYRDRLMTFNEAA